MSIKTVVKFPGELHYINMESFYDDKNTVLLPLLGTVAAGAPIFADEDIQEYIPVPKMVINNQQDGFLLKVKGDSMKDANILAGDLLICQLQPTAKNGDIVVAVIDGEATVKRYFHEGHRVKLQPENRKYKPIYLESDFVINGKVTGLIRTTD